MKATKIAFLIVYAIIYPAFFIPVISAYRNGLQLRMIIYSIVFVGITAPAIIHAIRCLRKIKKDERLAESIKKNKSWK